MMNEDAAEALYAYAVRQGQSVELTLLGNSPTYVEGKVATATTHVLILRTRTDRTVRVPWAAIATIRDTVTPHPATT